VDSKQVKAFWEARAARSDDMAYESLGNLEESPDRLTLKVKAEREAVFSLFKPKPDDTVLDLGCGVGQWTFQFASLANHITAVDYSEGMLAIAKKEAEARSIKNLTWIHSGAETFRTDATFDWIFISGLFVYLSDEQANMLMLGLTQHTRPGASVIVRDGSGVGERYQITDRYSEDLKANYSALYRSPSEYTDLFESNGFETIESRDMFPEGSPLNRWPETRLRLFHFRRLAR